jgi:hypothetical protein
MTAEETGVTSLDIKQDLHTWYESDHRAAGLPNDWQLFPLTAPRGERDAARLWPYYGQALGGPGGKKCL